MEEKEKNMSSDASSGKSVNLSLSGMTCASCANIIERTLNKVPGVKKASVNFSAEKALVFLMKKTPAKKI